MSFLYLRLLIGAAAAIFVAVVAVATLGLSVTIAFNTLRSNAEQSVLRLGAATAATTDAFFAGPEQKIKTLATLPQWTTDAATTPSEDPAFVQGEGGPTFEKWRRGLLGFAIDANFSALAYDVVFTDGSGCRLFNLPDTTAKDKSSAMCGIPNRSTAFVKIMTVHDRPSGVLNPFLTRALLPASQSFPFPSIRIPGYDQLLDRLIGNTSDGDVQWNTPIGTNDKGVDYHIVSVVTRILNTTGRIGVLMTHLTLDKIGAILTAAKLTAHTEAFVYDQDQFLVGASSGIPSFVGENFTGLDATPGCTTTAASAAFYPATVQRRMCRYHLTKAPFAPLATSVAAEMSFFTTARTVGTVKLIEKNYIFTQRLPTMNGHQRLFLATITPESDVLGDAESILPISAAVTAGIVVFIAVVSFVLIWVVLRPLQAIAVRMGKAARLEEDDTDVAVSPIAEIGDLQRAFIEMRDELGRIRAFVPQALLRVTSDDDDEAADYDHDNDHDMYDRITSVESYENNSGRTGRSTHRGGGGGRHQLTYETSKTHTHSTDPDSQDPHRSHLGVDNAGTPSSRSSDTQSHTSRTTTNQPPRAGAQAAMNPQKKTLNHMAGIRRETVAVLCVNLRGFHSATERGLSSFKMARIVEIVLAATQQERGVVDAFHGDRFMITFNAAKPCANCGIRATVTATKIAAGLRNAATNEASSTSPKNSNPRAEIKNINDVSRSNDVAKTKSGAKKTSPRPEALPYDLPVTCGVAVGFAHIGNVGSAAMKSFTVVGPVVTQSAMLERLCKMYESAQCLVPQRLFADLSTAVRLHTVDFVRLPFTQKPCLIADVLGEHQGLHGDEEWMYQLHAQENQAKQQSRRADSGNDNARSAAVRSGAQNNGDGPSSDQSERVNTSNAAWSLLTEGRSQDAVKCFRQLSPTTTTSPPTKSPTTNHPLPSSSSSVFGTVPAARANTTAESDDLIDTVTIPTLSSDAKKGNDWAGADVRGDMDEVQMIGDDCSAVNSLLPTPWQRLAAVINAVEAGNAQALTPRDFGSFYKIVTGTW